MSNTNKYTAPAVLRRLPLECGEDILAGSIVDALNAGGVKSHPQEVVGYDFSDAGFNHSWE